MSSGFSSVKQQPQPQVTQVTLSARIKLTQGPKFLCVFNCMVKNAQKLIEEEADGFSFHENMFLNNTVPSNI